MFYESKYLGIITRYKCHEAVFTDGSNHEESGACNTNTETYFCQLLNGATVVYAKLKVLSLAREHVIVVDKK